MNIIYLILSIMWSIIGIVVLFTITKIENKKDRKYVFMQYLLTFICLMINLVYNIFR